LANYSNSEGTKYHVLVVPRVFLYFTNCVLRVLGKYVIFKTIS